ncbi:MAG: hypothetical protein H7239_02735 [Flavobacterium sp.]|nr:hypothetical protein [Flavobacterium sp.]
MDLPNLLIKNLLSGGNIFYFTSNKILSNEPHNFVLLKNHNKLLYFSCCTKQYDTIQKYIIKSKNDENTLASLDYNKYDFLKFPTFINCNNYTLYTELEFVNLYNNSKIKFKGVLDIAEFELIKKGLLLSNDIEQEIKDLFL